MANSRFQILALDGGGLKGLFSAALLSQIEEDIGGGDLTRHFDLITGTSTGGIIATGLGLGLRPRELVRFYIENGAKIFPQDFPRARSLRHLFRSKYRSDELTKALKRCVGDKLLGHSRKRLVIPSFNLGESKPYLFKTAHDDKFRRDWRVPAWKVALATSSAPTYLPSFREVDSIRLIDGGVWANNPGMVGLVEAVGVLGQPLESVRVFSLGTTAEVRVRPDKLDGGGILQWKNHAADVIMGGQGAGADQQLQLLLGKERYLRLNPVAPPDFYKLDRASIDEHLALAANASRHVLADFRRMFGDHVAPDFVPTQQI